ncbi:hypothetical protein PspLS_09284 [Pyricularia sp. CBS 133598]|nr:hypothetical protein PspLS_09284 [Pyricularia sp. CBS 133598]
MHMQNLLAATAALALLPGVAFAFVHKCLITIRKADPALGKDNLYNVVSLPPSSDYTFGKYPPATAGVTLGVDQNCQERFVPGVLPEPYKYKGVENPFYGLTGVEIGRELQAWRKDPENMINLSLWLM